MARSTQEIREEKGRLIAEADKMKTNLEKALEDGPISKMRALIEECRELGHPNIAPSNEGGFFRKICPDCGYFEYI